MSFLLPPSGIVSRKGRLLMGLLGAAGRGYHFLRVIGRLASGRRPARIRRVLVVRRSLLGDMVVFLPTLAALRALYPNARIVLGVQPGMSAGFLATGSGDVDEIRELSFLSHSSPLARLAGALRLFADGFDLVISGARFFVIREAFFSGAPYRIGLEDGAPLQALNNRTLALDPSKHESENNLALVELLGARVEPVTRIPTLRLEFEASGKKAEELLLRLGVPEHAPILTIHPGAQKPSRRWPAERFAAVAAQLLAGRPELWVLFTGTPGEADLVDSIRLALPSELVERAPSLPGLTDLPTLLRIFDRSEAFVCNDTGVMHLARAHGTPLVALLGPENDLRWGPHPAGLAPAISLRYEVPCSPCSRWDCEGHYCLRSLVPNEVADAVSQLLDLAPGRNGRGASTLAAEDSAITLARHNVLRNWRELSEAGFSLPLVSMVVLPDANGDVPAGIEHQSYPRIELVRLEDTTTTPAPQVGNGTSPRSSSVRSVRVDSDSTESVWRTVLEVTRGEIIAFHPPGARWPVEKISDDVAALMREPGADVTVHGIIGRPGTLRGSQTWAQHSGAVVRRRWLAGQLAGAGTWKGRSGTDGMAEWLAGHLHTAVPISVDGPTVGVDR